MRNSSLEYKRVDEYQNRGYGGNRIFELEPSGLATEGDLFTLLGRVRHTSLRVAGQKFLTVWHPGRINRIGDRGPQRRADEKEGKRGPESVSDEAEDDISEARVLGPAAVRGDDNSDEGDVDEGKVEAGHVVEQDHAQTDEHVLRLLWVALVQSGSQRTRWLEGLGLTAQPGGQEEGAHNAKSDVGRHPKLIAGASLTGVVAGRDEQGQLAETVGDGCGEAGPDQPAELLFSREGDQTFAPQEDDRDGKEGKGQQEGVDTEGCIEEARETLSKGHLSNGITPEAELQLGSCVDGSNCPPRTLLEMSTKVFRHGTELKSLVNVCGSPSFAKHEC